MGKKELGVKDGRELSVRKNTLSVGDRDGVESG